MRSSTAALAAAGLAPRVALPSTSPVAKRQAARTTSRTLRRTKALSAGAGHDRIPESAGTLRSRAMPFTLAQLERAVREAWSEDTADAENAWSPENPSCGQCDITSLVVHDLIGGELLAADVFLDGERVEAHMWNRLPSGLEVDLTREQFRRGEVIGEPTVRQRPAELDPT